MLFWFLADLVGLGVLTPKSYMKKVKNVLKSK